MYRMSVNGLSLMAGSQESVSVGEGKVLESEVDCPGGSDKVVKEGSSCLKNDGISLPSSPKSTRQSVAVKIPKTNSLESPTEDHTPSCFDSHAQSSTNDHTPSSLDSHTQSSTNAQSSTNDHTHSTLESHAQSDHTPNQCLGGLALASGSKSVVIPTHTSTSIEVLDKVTTVGNNTRSLLSKRQLLISNASVSQDATIEGTVTRRNIIRTRSQRRRSASTKTVDSPFTSDLSESNLDSDDDSERTISSYSDNNHQMMTRRVTRSSQRRWGTVGGGVRKWMKGKGGIRREEGGITLPARRLINKNKATRYVKRLGLTKKRRSRMRSGILESSQTSESSDSDPEIKNINARKGCGYQCDAPQWSHSHDEEYLPPSKTKKQNCVLSSDSSPSSPPTKGNILAEILTGIPEVHIMSHSLTPSKIPRSSKTIPSVSNSALEAVVAKPQPLGKEMNIIKKSQKQYQSQSRSQSQFQASNSKHTLQSLSRTDRSKKSAKNKCSKNISESNGVSFSEASHADLTVRDNNRVKAYLELVDEGDSVHHKVLKSWESDYIRGCRATRGPILYMMENFPDKLDFEGAWMTKAKLIWTFWRHKVSESDRRLYTEKAKKNRFLLFGSAKGNKMDTPIRGFKVSKKLVANKEVPLKNALKKGIALQHCSSSSDKSSSRLHMGDRGSCIPKSVSSSLNASISQRHPTKRTRASNSTSKVLVKHQHAAHNRKSNQKSKPKLSVNTSAQNCEQPRDISPQSPVQKSKSLPPFSDVTKTRNPTEYTLSNVPNPSIFSASALSPPFKTLRSRSLPAGNVRVKRISSAELPGNACKRKQTSSESVSQDHIEESTASCEHLVVQTSNSSWFLTPSSQINSFCASSNLLTSIVPISPKKSKSFTSSHASGGQDSGGNVERLKILPNGQVSETDFTRFSEANYSITTQKHSIGHSKPLVQKVYTKKINSDNRISRSTKRRKGSQGLSPLISSHMPADMQSFVIPQMLGVSEHRIVNYLPVQTSFGSGSSVMQCNTDTLGTLSSSHGCSGSVMQCNTDTLGTLSSSHGCSGSVMQCNTDTLGTLSSSHGCSIMQCNTNTPSALSSSHGCSNNNTKFPLLAIDSSLNNCATVPLESVHGPRSSSTSSSALSSPDAHHDDDTYNRKCLSSTIHHTGTCNAGPGNHTSNSSQSRFYKGFSEAGITQNQKLSPGRVASMMPTPISPPQTNTSSGRVASMMPTPISPPQTNTSSGRVASMMPTPISPPQTNTSSGRVASMMPTPISPPQTNTSSGRVAGMMPTPISPPQTNTSSGRVSPLQTNTSSGKMTTPSQTNTPSSRVAGMMATPISPPQTNTSSGRVAGMMATPPQTNMPSSRVAGMMATPISPPRTNTSSGRVAGMMPTPTSPLGSSLPKLSTYFSEVSALRATVTSPVPFSELNSKECEKKGNTLPFASASDSESVFSPPTSLSRLAPLSIPPTPMIVDPPKIYLNEVTEITLATVWNNHNNSRHQHIKPIRSTSSNSPTDISTNSPSSVNSVAYPSSSNFSSPTIKNTSCHSGVSEIDLSKMSQWEVEQFYYYSTAILEQQKRLIKVIERHLLTKKDKKQTESSEQRPSEIEVYKRFLNFTIEPDVMPEETMEKFGFGEKSKVDVDDLIIGGTAQRPIINSKYDIYAKYGRRHK